MGKFFVDSVEKFMKLELVMWFLDAYVKNVDNKKL